MKYLLFDLDGTLVDRDGALARLQAHPERYPGDFTAGIVAAVEPIPGVADRLWELKRRYGIAIVTNGSAERQRGKIAAAGLDDVVSTVFVSAEVGSAKPDRQIFEAALAALGAVASQTMFVGDDPACDIEGAAVLGMQTCWIARGRSVPAELPATWTVNNIGEALDRL